MARRERRYLGCTGIFLALVLLSFAINAGLSWHFARGIARVSREMAAKGYPRDFGAIIKRQNVDDGRTNGAKDLLEAFDKFSDAGIDYARIPIMGEFRLDPSSAPIPPDVLAETKKLIDANRVVLQ